MIRQLMLGHEHIAARIGGIAVGSVGGLVGLLQEDGSRELSLIGLLVVALTTISYVLIRLVEKIIDRRAAKHPESKNPDEDPILLLRAIRDSLRDPLHPAVGMAATIGANHRQTEREFERLRGRLERLETRLFPNSRGEAGA